MSKLHFIFDDLYFVLVIKFKIFTIFEKDEYFVYLPVI